MNKLITIIVLTFIAVFSNSVLASTPPNKEVMCLARAMFYEAQGESFKGKLAVGNVIINRTKHKEFPSTICNVIGQRGQFQWYHNSALRRGRVFSIEKAQLEYFLAQEMYVSSLLGELKDVTGGAIFFSSNGVRPAPRAVAHVKIGRHQFYKLRMLRS